MLIMMGGALVLMLVSSLLPQGASGSAPAPSWPRPPRPPPWSPPCSSGTTSATHGPKVTIAGAIAYDGFDIFIQITISIAHVADRAGGRRLPPARGDRRARIPGARHAVGVGGDDDGRRQRPHRDLPRARDHVDRPLRARRLQPAARRSRGRPPSSTSCSARSPRPSSSTGSPSPTAPPARRTCPRSPTISRRTSSHRTACSSGARPVAGRVSASRSRRCRSTCGRPTSTRAPPRRSPASWRRSPRPVRSPRCCGCSSPSFGPPGPTGNPSCGCWPS